MNAPAATERDAKHVFRALELAVQARGRTSPNPLVGAVIVRGDRVIGEGYHAAYGKTEHEVRPILRTYLRHVPELEGFRQLKSRLGRTRLRRWVSRVLASNGSLNTRRPAAQSRTAVSEVLDSRESHQSVTSQPSRHLSERG